MENLRSVIADNLIALRKKNGMTQSDVANKLNYSDKSISKWEHADSLPDVEILYNLAELYGVTLDYLTRTTHEEETAEEKTENEEHLKRLKSEKANRIAIMLISVTVIWLIATIVFGYTVVNGIRPPYWQSFVWAVPFSSMFLLYYNRKRGNKIFSIILKSVLIWSLLASVYLQLISKNFWIIFILGVPVQVIIVLASQLTINKK